MAAWTPIHNAWGIVRLGEREGCRLGPPDLHSACNFRLWLLCGYLGLEGEAGRLSSGTNEPMVLWGEAENSGDAARAGSVAVVVCEETRAVE